MQVPDQDQLIEEVVLEPEDNFVEVLCAGECVAPAAGASTELAGSPSWAAKCSARSLAKSWSLTSAGTGPSCSASAQTANSPWIVDFSSPRRVESPLSTWSIITPMIADRYDCS